MRLLKDCIMRLTSRSSIMSILAMRCVGTDRPSSIEYLKKQKQDSASLMKKGHPPTLPFLVRSTAFFPSGQGSSGYFCNFRGHRLSIVFPRIDSKSPLRPYRESFFVATQKLFFKNTNGLLDLRKFIHAYDYTLLDQKPEVFSKGSKSIDQVFITYF